MKWFLTFLAAALLTVNLTAQPAPPISSKPVPEVSWTYAGGIFYSNGVPFTVATPAAPSTGLDMNPADAVNAIVDFVPAKYQKAALALIVLLLIAGRTWAAHQGTLGLAIPTKLAGMLQGLVLGITPAKTPAAAAEAAVVGPQKAPTPPPPTP